MRSTALSVHGGGGYLPVNPANRENLVGISGTSHADFREAIHVDAMLDVLPKVQATGGGVKKIKDLLVVDF